MQTILKPAAFLTSVRRLPTCLRALQEISPTDSMLKSIDMPMLTNMPIAMAFASSTRAFMFSSLDALTLKQKQNELSEQNIFDQPQLIKNVKTLSLIENTKVFVILIRAREHTLIIFEYFRSMF